MNAFAADPASTDERNLLAFPSLLRPFLCHRFCRLLLCFFPLIFAFAHGILLCGERGARDREVRRHVS